MFVAFERMVSATCDGLQSGFAEKRSAASAATFGVTCEVPLI
jgi:hypothetical protein